MSSPQLSQRPRHLPAPTPDLGLGHYQLLLSCRASPLTHHRSPQLTECHCSAGCSAEDFLRVLETHAKHLGFSWACWHQFPGPLRPGLLISLSYPMYPNATPARNKGLVREAGIKDCSGNVATDCELSMLLPQSSPMAHSPAWPGLTLAAYKWLSESQKWA